ncbi:MAG TPA: peptide deformylase [Candidatus Doudnabacteria bacterium]|nr:peptide deformylase [Candidatus Doudnabacteria bacterium]
MILPISKLPAKVLRTPTTEVPLPAEKKLFRLVKDMIATCKAADGVGLAAPQIGRNLNLAIIFLEEAGLPAFPIINPVITKTSSEQTELEEGCLSIPGVFGKVKRPKKITVEAYNLEGKKFTLTDDTFLARVLQHEIDHLNRILILDKFTEITTGQELLQKYQR